VKQQIAAYRQQDSDYLDKLSFARDARAAELKALGVPEDRIPGQLEMDEANLAMVALQNGRNPGQAAAEYAIAKGWKPKAAQEKPKQAAPQQTALEKLATIDAGQKAAKSLGGAGAPDPELTLEKVLEMTPEQIGALPEDKWRAVMGA